MQPTAKSLIEFLEGEGRAGRIKPTVATQLTGAVKKVFATQPDWAEIDISQLDIANTLAQFQNANSTEYSEASLAEYQNRFRRAIKMFLDCVSDPTKWRKAQKSTHGKTPTTEAVELPILAINSSGVQMIDYPFPLRDSCIIRLRLPANLKRSEVDRLMTFMHSIASDDNNA